MVYKVLSNYRPLISVIVPVYNGERYLHECLNSVRNQDYSNLEIICVNDGSIDSTEQILLNHANEDSRIEVIKQENLGVSAARNAGLDAAGGEFVMFLDADDTLSYDIVSNYLQYIERSVDHVVEGSELVEIKYDTEHLARYFYNAVRTQRLNSPCGKLYRLSLIKKWGIRFPTATSLGEDLLFNARFFQKVSDLLVVPGYRYRVRRVEGSATRSFRTTKYDELMYVHDSLRRLLDPVLGSKLDSLLNFIRIRALLSCGMSLIGTCAQSSSKTISKQLSEMERSNASLPVKHGDFVMRALGFSYNRLGLETTLRMFKIARCARNILSRCTQHTEQTTHYLGAK